MFGALARTASKQYAMRKDVLWCGGMALFWLNADHLILERSKNKLKAVGLFHEGNLTPRFSTLNF